MTAGRMLDVSIPLAFANDAGRRYIASTVLCSAEPTEQS
jgi:hypothetical protein